MSHTDLLDDRFLDPADVAGHALTRSVLERGDPPEEALDDVMAGLRAGMAHRRAARASCMVGHLMANLYAQARSS